MIIAINKTFNYELMIKILLMDSGIYVTLISALDDMEYTCDNMD